MNWLSFHVASGASLFSGVLLLIAGIFFCGKRNGRGKFLAKLLGCIGLAAVFLSSTPFATWTYLLLVGLVIGWLVLESLKPVCFTRSRMAGRGLVIAACAVMAFVEFPNQLLQRLPNAKHSVCYVVGDSISAGIDDTPNWVEVYGKNYGNKIMNLAKPAATLSSALTQAKAIPSTEALVLLEIGGNDLLGRTTPKEFERDLDLLLAAAQKPNRTLVMFELPLLPGQAGLGRVQRSLAKEHKVWLIPKRYFCKVLGTKGATTDGLHLSASGSAPMAKTVNELIGPMLVQPAEVMQSISKSISNPQR